MTVGTVFEDAHIPLHNHLHRYLAEFDFRYSNRVALGVNDEARATRALKGIAGKRLTYRGPSAPESEIPF